MLIRSLKNPMSFPHIYWKLNRSSQWNVRLTRVVVEVMRMVVDFIENLEAKINTVYTIPAIDESMSNL
ncbi:unnamed protein product, partial [Coregonus sp. 'balchen']